MIAGGNREVRITCSVLSASDCFLSALWAKKLNKFFGSIK
ncbi:hypothetical protein HMPREF1141_0949 [Clostridium sp. MSTE9]|nr:hypothetical protein HMPREF1141_0949 [Clostridium sp. MSTE9]